jgi:hypothetical protein
MQWLTYYATPPLYPSHTWLVALTAATFISPISPNLAVLSRRLRRRTKTKKRDKTLARRECRSILRPLRRMDMRMSSSIILDNRRID